MRSVLDFLFSIDAKFVAALAVIVAAFGLPVEDLVGAASEAVQAVAVLVAAVLAKLSPQPR